MKQGTVVTRIVIVILFLAVVSYLGIYLWQGLTDPYQFVVTYAYELEDGALLDGFIVREERVVEGQSALAEVLPAEGERVGVGAAVAVLYQSPQALEDHREAENLELQLEQLQYAMGRNDAVGDAQALDAQLVDAVARLKKAVSADELGELEDNGLALRSLVLKRTGSEGTTAESLASLQASAAQLEGEIARLRAAAAQQTRQITVDESGLFSGLVDGFESVLEPSMLDAVTVAQLEELKGRGVSTPRNAIGKLITGRSWYYLTSVDDATAQRLTQGNRYTLRFSGDFCKELSMRLERLGALEEGRRVAVFSSDKFLGQATLARLENATLVFHSYAGVRAPDKALRVLDNGDGTTTLGVYALVGRQAEFKPVEIVREGDGFYLLKGTATNRKVLRAGDMLILSNQELYDGKVVA